MKTEHHQSRKLIGPILFFGVLVQFHEPVRRVLCVRVTVQDHKPLLAFVDDCITVYLKREFFTVKLRTRAYWGKKVIRATHFPYL